MSSGLQEICEQWFVSPYIRYGYDRYKVKGYTEKDNTSTSMVFKDQDKKNKLVTIGTQFSTQTQNADTNLDVSYTREAHPQEFIASGRLKNFARALVVQPRVYRRRERAGYRLPRVSSISCLVKS